ncbi:MAG: Smr/MutS family protein [Candidatus Binatia bacterium]
MRRRKRGEVPGGQRPQTDTFQYRPFRGLPPRSAAAAPPAPNPPQPSKAALPPVERDDALFLREVADVRPLSSARKQRVAPAPPAATPRAVTDPDAEALAELSDLVAGAAEFDIANSVEFVEGAVAGLDPRLVRRLRAGDFAYQAHIDLHGLTAEEARATVDRFLSDAYRKGHRCVLIIHGRGLNSKDQVPVLKSRLAGWLTRGTWARCVLSFTSARPCDGGAGALYVLLRRQRQTGARKPIHVTHGAKW